MNSEKKIHLRLGHMIKIVAENVTNKIYSGKRIKHSNV